MIKLFACIFMIIDHIGLAFFQNDISYRVIGRLSMPMFAWALARGFTYTSNRKKQFFRIFLLAVISQVPYMLLTDHKQGNICVLWLLCLGFLNLYTAKDKCSYHYIGSAALVLIAILVPFDYGWYGFALTIIFYFFGIKPGNKNYTMQWIFITLITGLYILTDYEKGLIQIFALVCIPIIYIMKKYDNKVKINKHFYYWFYPGHMLILCVIKWLCRR